MQFSWPTFLLSDWNLNSKQDSQRSVLVFESIMRPECIPKPTKEQWELTALEFEKTANSPHCLGAVDGKHIRVIKPEHSGSKFYNYKDFFPWY